MMGLKRRTRLLFIVALCTAIFTAYVVTTMSGSVALLRPLLHSKETGYQFVLCQQYQRNELALSGSSKPHYCYNPWDSFSAHSNRTFTMIIQTYNRTDILPKVLTHYCGMVPTLKLIILVWNNVNVKPPTDLWRDLCPIKVLTQKRNKMRNRLQNFPEMEGKAILMMDDDILVPLPDVLFAFRVWQQFPQLIVGFYPRKHVEINGSYVYGTRETDSGTSFHKKVYSMILIGAAFFHREYLRMFNDEALVPRIVHDMIDAVENCDDIAMNTMVAHFLAKAAFPQCPGLFVRSQSRQVIENARMLTLSTCETVTRRATLVPTILQRTWSVWSNWTECSRSCGGGSQRRFRECLGDERTTALNCTGNRINVQPCNTQCCAVNGGFTIWSDWSPCSVSCGNGTQYRSRSCTSPAPYCGGTGCTGASTELMSCATTPCPVDCIWLNWSDWSACNRTCSGGWRYRTRSNFPARYSGKDCAGATREEEACNSQPCPVDGYWKAWGEWSACSSTCDGGIQTRTRACVPPVYGGLDCEGDSQQTKPCEVMKCPIDCQWTEWGSWSRCSATCNGGIHARIRQQSVAAQNGGKPCIGDAVQTDACNSQPCPNPCKDHGHPCYNSLVECTPLSDTQFRCGPCQTGLTGNGVTCFAVNECNLATPCFPEANCTDLWLGYACGLCPSGYNGSSVYGPDLSYALAHKQNCSDVDECAAATKPCHPLRQCTNTAGGYSCGPCPPGYASDGRTQCLLTDPCVAKLHNCEKDAYCINTGLGAFRCQCPNRMYGNGLYCIPYGDFDGVAGIPFPDNFSGVDDMDYDGIRDDQDNCPYVPNADQLDSDWDSDGDECDNCRLFRNTNQADLDGDGIGDVCDMDQDGDQYLNLFDTCPRIPNPSQTDTDADGFGDECDSCVFVPTATQADGDYNGVGDACDSHVDRDGDGRQNDIDNCPQTRNAGQADADADGVGDACDSDEDNDGLLNEVDSCPLVYNPTNDSSTCAGDFDGDHVPDDIDVCPDNAKISKTDLSHFVSVPLIPNPSIGIEANWNAKTGSDVVLTAAIDPYILIGPTPFSSLEYSGTFYVSKSTGHGYAGAVFNYQSNKRFMVAMWKKENETIQMLGQDKHALAGMQVKLINSNSGPSNPAMYGALWNTGDTNGQVKTLWRDPKFQSWEVQHPYKWKILYSNETSCMRLTTYDGLNMQLLVDSGCICGLTPLGGRVGLFTFNQGNVIWTNIEAKCYTDKQMQC